jgi:hypothetical protein
MIFIISNGKFYSGKKTLFVTVDDAVAPAVTAAFERLKRDDEALPKDARLYERPCIIATADKLDWRGEDTMLPLADVLTDADTWGNGDFPHIKPCPIAEHEWDQPCTCWRNDVVKAAKGES